MRLFIAIDLSRELRAELAALQRELRPVEEQLKLVNPENLHLTVQFLGDCEQQKVPEITKAMDSVSAECQEFSIELSGTGCFPNPRRPKVLWVGLQDQQDRLQQCADACRRELENLGFGLEERDFSAHLTVARLAERADAQTIVELFNRFKPQPLKQQVRYLALYQSVLRQQGALYTCLYRAEFKKA